MLRQPLVLVVVILAGSFGIEAHGASPTRSEKGDAGREAVARVLRREAGHQIDRRTELTAALEQNPDLPGLRWQAGYVRMGGAWTPVEEAAPQPAEREKLSQYQTRRESAASDSQSQFELATWCRKQQLPDQERSHLLAALDQAPPEKQPVILQRLGYRQFGEQWLSLDQVRQWQSSNRRATAAIKQWGPRIEKLAERLDGSRKQSESAAASLKQIAEAGAIPVIECVLCGRNEACAAAAVEALDGIDGFEGAQALARQTVFSPWPSVRRRGAELLKPRRFEDFVPALIGLLAAPVTSKISNQLYYFQDCPGNGPVGQFVLLSNYVLAQETDNQFNLAVMNTVDLRLNDLLSGSVVSFRGGFHIRPDVRTPLAVRQLAALRAANDHARNSATDAYQRDKLVTAINDRTDELNRQVVNVLAAVSGRDATPDAGHWWQWWADFTDTQQAGDKPSQVVSQSSQYLGDYGSRVSRRSCFAAGTPVWTESGRVPIESIRVGDRVLAQSIGTGELAFKPVLSTTTRPPRDLVHLRVAGEEIDATSGHRFWVSGSGWVKSRDLAPGVLVRTTTGNVPIEAVETGPTAETYNLVVADFHDYFVGAAGMLVQDLPLPEPTNAVVPGLARK